MRHRRPAPIRPDILHLAQDNLCTADQVTVFGSLSMRSLPPLPVTINAAVSDFTADAGRVVASLIRSPLA